MYKIRCIVIEDEPLAVKILTDYISKISFLQLQGCFKDAIQAAEFLLGEETDLLFLDIHLPRLKGMDFLRSLSKPPMVIVTTAYHQYAVEAFDLNVTDYLLKPFEFERFLSAVNKLQLGTKKSGAVSKTEERDYIFLTVDKKKVRILFAEILFVESQLEYVKVVTLKKTFISKLSTHEIELMLPKNQFMRIHRSFIIALDKIESFTTDTVELPGHSIPIGRAYRHVLEKF